MVTKLKNFILKNHVEYLLYFSLFCLFLIWSMMLRFNDAPDELGRYSICQYIFNHNKLPHGGDMEIRMNAWGFSYAFQPILSYIIGSFFMKIASLFTSNTYFYLIAARFVSVLCGVIMAVFIRKISLILFKDPHWQWIFTLLVVLLPQCMFMFVYVNTDSMALMSCAIITYAWLIGYRTHWSFKTCFLLSIGIILNAMSYYNAYGFILCSIIIFIVYHISYSNNSKKLIIDWRNLIKKSFFISFLVFLGTGWWFIRSYFLYNGDFLGLRTRNDFAEKYATTEYLKPSNAKTYYNAGLSLFKMLKDTDYIHDLYYSFIGQFGNMSIVLHQWIYLGFSLIFSFALIGLFLKKHNSTVIPRKIDKNKFTFNICMSSCIIIPIILCTYSSYITDYQPQGRYILPIIIPFMYFITIGLKQFCEYVFRDIKFLYITTKILSVWLFVSVFFFMKDMVFSNYWTTLVSFMKALL